MLLQLHETCSDSIRSLIGPASIKWKDKWAGRIGGHRPCRGRELFINAAYLGAVSIEQLGSRFLLTLLRADSVLIPPHSLQPEGSRCCCELGMALTYCNIAMIWVIELRYDVL